MRISRILSILFIFLISGIVFYSPVSTQILIFLGFGIALAVIEVIVFILMLWAGLVTHGFIDKLNRMTQSNSVVYTHKELTHGNRQKGNP